MTYKENLTSEEIAQRKAARKRFREIVKQRWQEETLKNLSKKAFKKISKNATPEPDLILLAKEVGGSLRVRFRQGVWYLHFTFFSKKVESAAANLTEAINGLIINKHLQNSQFTINK